MYTATACPLPQAVQMHGIWVSVVVAVDDF